ncbi:MAG: adenylate/guanylate cyclase domain-containing protein, partial [Myxococcota bacterium]
PSFVDFDTRALDAAAALKAARAISSQMRLSGLIRSLVETAVETTGANFAALVAPYEGDLRVVAELEGSETTIWERESASSLDESLTRAAGLVRRATTQRSAVRLDNAWEHAELGEAYDRPVSVLCVPLFKGTELQGVLYLENTLATAAFRKDHVELAELLAGQATVSLENARLFEDLRSAYDGQTQLAESFARFVPPQFLDALGKSSVLDVHRGDAVSGEFSVLFADIRDFSARAEGLGPEGTFSFVNRYLQHVEPAIHRYEGFVHQLLGDGIVALFPTAHLAVKGALAMLAGTHALNTQLVHENIAPVKIGCGISSGRLMMGAIGGSTRLDRGIIGDVANVASRVEGMTKLYGTPLLVSGPTRMALVGSGDFRLRLVDRVIPAGKTEILEVFEVLDALDAREAELRQRQRPEWDQALEAWRAGSASARQHFEAVIEMGPDPAAEVYLARLTAGAPTPVTRLQVK